MSIALIAVGERWLLRLFWTYRGTFVKVLHIHRLLLGRGGAYRSQYWLPLHFCEQHHRQTPTSFTYKSKIRYEQKSMKTARDTRHTSLIPSIWTEKTEKPQSRIDSCVCATPLTWCDPIRYIVKLISLARSHARRFFSFFVCVWVCVCVRTCG